jgi:diphthine synthase
VIIEEARKQKVAFLTAGDPMSATTHVAIRLKALKEGIQTKIIHGVSVVTASAGLLGLQIYKFGRITTIPFPKKGYLPSSPYEVIKGNKEMSLHSLVLLDISSKKFMTANEGMATLLEIERKKKENVVTKDTLIAVVARLSSDNPLARAGKVEKLLKEDFGGPPHSLVIPGKLHFMESRALVKFAGAPSQ